jgi:hypothetical protein
MVDFTRVPIPPSPRINISQSMSPRELAAAVQQIDLWTRQTRAFLEALRDAIIELQNESD